MSEITIPVDVTSTGLTVNAGDTLHVLGSATETSVSGQMIVSAGGWSTETSVSGQMVVSAGGLATDTTVEQGGRLLVMWGDGSNVQGKALQIKENGGYVDNYGDATFVANTFSNLTLAAQSATVHSGTVADRTTINSGAILNIYSSGIALDTKVTGGALNVSTGGVADRTAVSAGFFRVFSGAVANNATVFGGQMQAQAGGILNSTTVSGGKFFVYGTANNTKVNAGNEMHIYEGGIANSTTLASKGAALHVSSGAVANDTTVNAGGSMYISAGGVANNATMLGSGDVVGKLYAYTDGVISSATIGAGGAAYIYRGAVVNSATVNEGGQMYLANANGTGSPVASNTIVNGGTFGILSTGVAVDTLWQAGSLIVSSGATIIGTTVTANTLNITSKFTASNTIAAKDGIVNVGTSATTDGVTVLDGGSAVISATAVVSNLDLQNGGAASISTGATLIGTTVGINLTISSGVVATDTTVNNGALVVAASGSTVSGVTVNQGGTLNLRSDVSNLDLLQGGSATAVGNVNGGSISGNVTLSGGTLNDVVFGAGADVLYSNLHVLTATNAEPDADDFSGKASLGLDGNGRYFEFTNSDESLFFNGNTVSMSYTKLKLAENANLYVGKNFDASTEADNGNYTVGGGFSFTTFSCVDGTINQVFNGGKVNGAFGGTITGDTSMVISNFSANRIYAGYDVLEAAGSTLTVVGDSTLDITGGTVSYIRGGVLKSDGNGGAMVVEGNASTKVTNTIVASVVGDYQVGAGAVFSRVGDVSVTVDGTASITGTLAGAGVSFGGEYTLDGSVSTTIKGGLVQGSIFGGVTIGSTGAVAISEKCEITGDVDITIDCSANAVVIGNSSNKVTSIFTGSYAKGIVGGDATLTLTGDSANLQLLSAEDGVVEFIGDSTLATNRKGYVDGTSSLVFDGFNCTDTNVLNVQNIAGFDTIEFKNGSNVQIGLLETLADVDTWKFNAVEGLTVLKVGNLLAANDFAGDTIDIAFDDTTLNSCTLMDMGDSADWSTGLSDSIVKFNGTEAIWNGSDAFVADGFSLSVVNDKSLVLSKLA